MTRSSTDDEREDGDDDDTLPCPYCRRPVFEGSPRCPYCENYISEEDSPPAPRRWWFILGFLGCLFVLYLWITRG